MTLQQTIKISVRWMNFCNDLVDNKNTEASNRSRIVAALLHLSMEHHGAIYLLTLNKHYGSAFALLRPQFESFIRGIWFLHCATDEQIDSFIKNKEPPKINSLLKDIESIPGYEEGTLKKAKDEVWSTLCGYTHGGYFQDAYRNTETEIAPDYDEEHIIGLLIMANNITLLTMVAFARLVNNDKLATDVANEHKELFGGKSA